MSGMYEERYTAQKNEKVIASGNNKVVCTTRFTYFTKRAVKLGKADE